jgi:hypothetical protein
MKKSLNICCDGPKIKNIGAYLTILQEILLICKFYKKKILNFFLIIELMKNFFLKIFCNN